MNERELAYRFSQAIEKLVKDVHELPKTMDYDDYKDELKLAKVILEQDFSKESPIREDLKKKLLTELNAPKELNSWRQNQSFYSDGELSEEELDYAAGGHSLKEESACTKCGCKRSRATIAGDICPDCGHARDDHM